MSFRIFKSSSVIFYTYDDILLRLYVEVARNGEFKRLIKAGRATNEQCLAAWEEIVKRQEKETGSHHYTAFLQLIKGYAAHLSDHTLIRACLIHLMIAPIDWEVLQTLRSKGYNIDTSTQEKKIESIQAGLRRCENLVTKATMKKKELERMFESKGKGNEQGGFEQILANLNFALGFNVDESITLARYNEYQKILKAKQKATEEANGRNKQRGSYK